jgi:predicted 2-oxoglutarate/Fe(II)-dependent dioxygenase YbiX
MDRASSEAAEVLADDISLDLQARQALSVDVDEATIALVEAALDGERPGIAAFFAQPLDQREGPGFLRYGPGGFYRPHRDRGEVPSWPAASRRAVAVVTFLNDDFTGGHLRILEDDNPIDIVPQEGTLVAFPAMMLHEVAQVLTGTRDTVVDWFYSGMREAFAVSQRSND